MWRYDGLSEDNHDIAYRDSEAPTPINIESNESDNRPLQVHSPRKTTTSEIHFTLGDKTTKIIVNKKTLHVKPSHEIKRTTSNTRTLWNIIPDRTITNYIPHTITVYTPLKKHNHWKKRFSNSNRN